MSDAARRTRFQECLKALQDLALVHPPYTDYSISWIINALSPEPRLLDRPLEDSNTPASLKRKRDSSGEKESYSEKQGNNDGHEEDKDEGQDVRAHKRMQSMSRT